MTPLMASNASNLPPVFLDGQRVFLQGDPCPPVAKILEAGGKSSDQVEVVRVKGQSDSRVLPLRLWDTIDRTRESSEGVHLKSVPKPSGNVPLHERSSMLMRAPTFGADYDDGLPEWGFGKTGFPGTQGTPGNVAGAKKYQQEMEDEGRGHGGPFKETGNIHKGPTGIGKADVDEVRRKSEGN
ncbi:MAG: hypothetical protein QOD77_445 [Thermoplasmata archaeon]|jgi:hypothetical protein|nr:hypothetical protein [Thermoplasmata archaeon]